MFYDYRQNNSGGYFDVSPKRGIGHYVIIEADSPADADMRAEAIGLYFDGCDDDIDCNCCGDRWGRTWGDGNEVPSIYSTPLKRNKRGFYIEKESFYNEKDSSCGYVHYKDKPFETIYVKQEG
jgi:hypothetical protein